MHNQAPGFFAFGARDFNVPQPGDIRRFFRGGNGRLVGNCMEWIGSAFPSVRTRQFAAGELGFQPGGVMIESQHQRAVFKSTRRSMQPSRLR